MAEGGYGEALSIGGSSITGGTSQAPRRATASSSSLPPKLRRRSKSQTTIHQYRCHCVGTHLSSLSPRSFVTHNSPSPGFPRTPSPYHIIIVKIACIPPSIVKQGSSTLPPSPEPIFPFPFHGKYVRLSHALRPNSAGGPVRRREGSASRTGDRLRCLLERGRLCRKVEE